MSQFLHLNMLEAWKSRGEEKKTWGNEVSMVDVLLCELPSSNPGSVYDYMYMYIYIYRYRYVYVYVCIYTCSFLESIIMPL